MWARYFFAFVLSFVFSKSDAAAGAGENDQAVSASRPLRAAAVSTILNLFALRWLQLDEALSILFATPFLVALLSVPMLGETVGWRRWTAIGVGFFGVLVVTQPGFGGMHPAAFLTMLGVVCYAFYVISTRVLSRTNSSETTQFYTNLVGALAMTAVFPFVWSKPDGILVSGLMVLIGALGGGGHYLLILAHRRAPASALAPFIYTQMIWTTTLGFLVFGMFRTIGPSWVG